MADVNGNQIDLSDENVLWSASSWKLCIWRIVGVSVPFGLLAVLILDRDIQVSQMLVAVALVLSVVFIIHGYFYRAFWVLTKSSLTKYVDGQSVDVVPLAQIRSSNLQRSSKGLPGMWDKLVLHLEDKYVELNNIPDSKMVNLLIAKSIGLDKYTGQRY